jgi:hypothetical protein
VALRELGRIKRTLFILDWLQSVELRRRVHAGLNNERAQLGDDGLVLWNTVYLERATKVLNGHDATLLQYLSLLCWEAHQPDGQPPLAHQRQDRRGQVQAATPAEAGLAYDFSEF